VSDYLSDENYRVIEASSGAEGLEKLDSSIDLILLDLGLPDIDGLKLAEEILKKHPGIFIIVISGYNDSDKIVRAIKCGVQDYIVKPIELAALKFKLDRLAEKLALREKVDYLEKMQDSELIGESPEIIDIRHVVDKIAETDFPVFITGETGTGKEILSGMIHRMSGVGGNFVALNCASIPEALFESELFGHSAHSFTDAKKARKGKVQLAAGGTLFFDEIGEMPITLQPKLLRLIEQKEFWPLGSDKRVTTDVRIICATNREITEIIKEGILREDLYYRLNTIHIHLPPLRNRKDDIEILAYYFLKQTVEKTGKRIAQIDKSVLDSFRDYSFPGNVRELKNIIERAVIFCESGRIELKYITGLPGVQSVDINEFDRMPLEKFERQYILKVFNENGRNVSQTSRALEISRTTLRDKLKRYGDI
jgi:DNA-binding NtrC family response regulator